MKQNGRFSLAQGTYVTLGPQFTNELHSPSASAIAAAWIQPGVRPLAVEPMSSQRWSALLAEVVRARIEPLLVGAITSKLIAVTDEQHCEARAAHIRRSGTVLLFERRLTEFASSLQAERIEFRVLKGPALARTAYPDPGYRMYCDLDILVRSADFSKAVRLLEQGGATRRYDEPRAGFDERFVKAASFLPHRGVAIDLHRTLVLGPFGLAIELEELFASSQLISVQGAFLPALSNELAFVHAALHGALGDWPPRLVPLVDLTLLSRTQIDYDEVNRIIERWRAREPVRSAFQAAVAHGLLSEAEVPPGCNSSGSALERAALSLYQRRDRSYAQLAIAAVPLAGGPRQQFDYLTTLAFPETSYLGRREKTIARRLCRASCLVADAMKTALSAAVGKSILRRRSRIRRVVHRSSALAHSSPGEICHIAMLLNDVQTRLLADGLAETEHWLSTQTSARRSGPSEETGTVVSEECFKYALACRIVRRPNCLARALVLVHLLKARQVEATVVYGVKRTAEGDTFHAWVETHGRIVGQKRTSLHSFTRFDPAQRANFPMRPTG